MTAPTSPDALAARLRRLKQYYQSKGRLVRIDYQPVDLLLEEAATALERPAGSADADLSVPPMGVLALDGTHIHRWERLRRYVYRCTICMLGQEYDGTMLPVSALERPALQDKAVLVRERSAPPDAEGWWYSNYDDGSGDIEPVEVSLTGEGFVVHQMDTVEPLNESERHWYGRVPAIRALHPAPALQPTGAVSFTKPAPDAGSGEPKSFFGSTHLDTVPTPPDDKIVAEFARTISAAIAGSWDEESEALAALREPLTRLTAANARVAELTAALEWIEQDDRHWLMSTIHKERIIQTREKAINSLLVYGDYGWNARAALTPTGQKT